MSVSQTLSVTEVAGSVNHSANTSKVRILWQSTQSGDSWNGYTRIAKYYISINGGAETEYSVSYTLPKSTTTTIIDTTVTIPHNSDGSGSVRVRTWMETSISAGVIERSQTINLTSIPRASTIEAVSDKYLGEFCSIRWTPLSPSFRYKLKFSIGSWESTTSAIHPNQTTSYLYSGHTLLLDAATQIPNDIKGTMSVTLYTYSDSNATVQVGSSDTKTFTVYVPDNENTKPNVTKMDITPISNLNTSFAGLFLQGVCRVNVYSTEEAKYGASIVRKIVTVEGKDYGELSYYTTDYLSGYGIISVSLTIQDSRGITTTKTQNISVIPYSKPRVIPKSGETSIVCARCDVSGNITDSGTYLKIKARRSYSLCMADGVQKNLCSVRFRYRKASDVSFSEWQTILPTNAITEDIDTVVLGGALSPTLSYVVQVDAVDSVSNHTYVTFDIPTEDVYLHKAGSIGSLGFGEYVEDKNTISIAKDKSVLVKGKLNGVYIRTKEVIGTAEININTKHIDYTGVGDERQTFFIFGAANANMVYGLARVSDNGNTSWVGTNEVTLSTKSGGILTVTLPTVAYDVFTIISGREFSV